MLFNTWSYIVFLPAVCLVYFLIPHKIRWVWLLAASYFFYACWNVRYALLMLLSTGITFLSGILIGREKEKEGGGSVTRMRWYVALSFISNLAILFFFKYYGMFTDTLQAVFDAVGASLRLPSFEVLLPVGISFYTFQALSYTADVYRGDIEYSKHFGKYALFVSFFPQLVAGPIERSSNLLPQVDEYHTFQYERARDGFIQLLWGMLKKVVIADRLAILVDTVYNSPQGHTGPAFLLATVFFAIQIYCDFSGYSDIAIGSARIMGFRLMENFRQPYLSRSIAEFWRRWHISLSTWFKDYLYIPLGGSRVSMPRWCFNIMVVFLVSGLWHGANWTFVVWGALHGGFQLIGRFTHKQRDALLERAHITPDGGFRHALSTCITFLLVLFAWVFFRANTMADALLIVRQLFSPALWTLPKTAQLGLGRADLLLSTLLIVFLMAMDVVESRTNWRTWLQARPMPVRHLAYLALIFCMILFGIYGDMSAGAFIYFQF